jgi:hypothetical protein
MLDHFSACFLKLPLRLAGPFPLNQVYQATPPGKGDLLIGAIDNILTN